VAEEQGSVLQRAQAPPLHVLSSANVPQAQFTGTCAADAPCGAHTVAHSARGARSEAVSGAGGGALTVGRALWISSLKRHKVDCGSDTGLALQLGRALTTC